jgi:hypothetical protein
LIIAESNNRCGMLLQQLLNHGSRLIAATEPNDFWRTAQEHSQVRKVDVMANDRKTIVFGVLPNNAVVGLVQLALTHLLGTGKNIREKMTKLVTQILIEEQFHLAGDAPLAVSRECQTRSNI